MIVPLTRYKYDLSLKQSVYMQTRPESSHHQANTYTPLLPLLPLSLITKLIHTYMYICSQPQTDKPTDSYAEEVGVEVVDGTVAADIAAAAAAGIEAVEEEEQNFDESEVGGEEGEELRTAAVAGIGVEGGGEAACSWEEVVVEPVHID